MANFTVYFLALCVYSVIGNTPNVSKDIRRNYLPEEDKLTRTYFLWEDENGIIHRENLYDEGVQVAVTVPEVKFYLYTIDNPVYGEVIYPNETFNNLVFFEKKITTVFVIHGWNNNYKSPINNLLLDALLPKHNLNVFIVDWSKEANRNYFSAKSAVPLVGQIVANYINALVEHFKLSYKNIMLIGHSLGAHAAGAAGAQTKQNLSYIIGLDPASPLFALGNTDERIDPTDAEFVQIIHTNGGYLGFSSSLGHADYYPNGGSRQPGCGFDILGTCAHSRSFHYLAESFGRSGFNAHLCDTYKEYSSGKCYANEKSYLGEIHIDKAAYGDYYLTTNPKSPYGYGAPIL